MIGQGPRFSPSDSGFRQRIASGPSAGSLPAGGCIGQLQLTASRWWHPQRNNREIAERLGVAATTARDRTQVVRRVLEIGLLQVQTVLR